MPGKIKKTVTKGTNGDDDISDLEGLDDTIEGFGGNDEIDGGDGDDVIKGGKGDDFLLGGAGDDIIEGGADKDVIDGGSGDDSIKAGRGDDIVIYTVAENNGSVDHYEGNAGSDTLKIVITSEELEALDITVAEIRAFFDAENAIDGKVDFNDFNPLGFNLVAIQFEILEMTVIGSAGADMLIGSEGNDTLIGGAGDDTLTGGAGDDTFVYSAGDGSDTITDFIAGISTDDKLDLSSFGLSGFADVNLVIAGGDDATVTVNGELLVTLAGVSDSSLVDGDFIF